MTKKTEGLLKLAGAFRVNMDFLIREGEISSFHKEMIKWIEDIERLARILKSISFSSLISSFRTLRRNRPLTKGRSGCYDQ